MTFPIDYVHCVRAVPGKPDRAPFTQYVWRTADALMYRLPADPMLGETEDTFRVDVDGKPVGYGDTKTDAIGDARYRLMDASRTAAGFDYTGVRS